MRILQVVLDYLKPGGLATEPPAPIPVGPRVMYRSTRQQNWTQAARCLSLLSFVQAMRSSTTVRPSIAQTQTRPMYLLGSSAERWVPSTVAYRAASIRCTAAICRW